MNYKYLIFVLLFLFVGCSNHSTPQKKVIPSWYTKSPKNNITIYGYGTSVSLKNAKMQAREEIAKSIRVNVRSEYQTMLESKNEVIQKKIKQTISEYTNIVLEDISVDKIEEHDQLWYVRMKYLNLPVVEQIRLAFEKNKLSKMKICNPLYYSEFSKKLKKVFGYTPNYIIFYKNGIFFINMYKHNFILDIKQIHQFFFIHENPDILFHASKENLIAGEYFHFIIDHRKDRYISLLQIDEDGKVIVHFGNVVSDRIIYPNLGMYEGLEAGILNNKDKALEMYIVVSCQDRKNFAKYEEVSLDYMINNDALRFPHLFDELNECEYSSLILKTTKK